jgi:RNA polymerase-binding protein DksA
VKASTLERLKTKLLAMRKRLAGDVDQIKQNSLQRRDAACGDVSAMPIHMADIAGDNFEKEFALGLIENEQLELRAIDAALQKLDAGAFGECEACGTAITYSRLKAIPYARLCIECQRAEEGGSA